MLVLLGASIESFMYIFFFILSQDIQLALDNSTIFIYAQHKKDEFWNFHELALNAVKVFFDFLLNFLNFSFFIQNWKLKNKNLDLSFCNLTVNVKSHEHMTLRARSQIPSNFYENKWIWTVWQIILWHINFKWVQKFNIFGGRYLWTTHKPSFWSFLPILKILISLSHKTFPNSQICAKPALKKYFFLQLKKFLQQEAFKLLLSWEINLLHAEGRKIENFLHLLPQFDDWKLISNVQLQGKHGWEYFFISKFNRMQKKIINF